MINRAVFLLVGASSRFRGIVKHKCLLAIAGQTILERQIIQSANLGTRDFVFVVWNNRKDVLIEAMRVFAKHEIPISSWSAIYDRHHATTKAGYALQLCGRNGSTLLWESDIVTSGFCIPWREHDTWFLVNGFTGEGSYVFPGNGYVQDQQIAEEIPGDGWYKSAGIYYLVQQPSVISPQHTLDDIFRQMNMRTITLPLASWHEIDTIPDFEEAKEKFTEPVGFQIDPALI